MTGREQTRRDADTEVPRTKLWDGVIVLECVCGGAVDYPGHPDERETVMCESCHMVYGLVQR